MAVTGDWAGFVDVMGGPCAPRAQNPVTVARAWSEKETHYGEPTGNQALGLETGHVTVPTRIHKWSIKILA